MCKDWFSHDVAGARSTPGDGNDVIAQRDRGLRDVVVADQFFNIRDDIVLQIQSACERRRRGEWCRGRSQRPRLRRYRRFS
jgi:hypothetical protein